MLAAPACFLSSAYVTVTHILVFTAAAIPPAPGQVSSLFPLTDTSGGITISQTDRSQVAFQAQTSGGGCPAPDLQAGQYCALPEFNGATLTSNGLTWRYSQKPGAGTFTYSQVRSSNGTFPLISETDPAGNVLTITYQSPAPGSGHCPIAASSCETITAASGRTLVIGSNGNGLVTSVTDPMGRSWLYAYNSGTSQLASATSPMGHKTSYTYGPGATGNPLLANALLTITGPNAQPGGPDDGDATVNTYDTLGRVASQRDPQGGMTTFNYCVNAAAGDCMDPATGNGFVTTTDPDGNTTVDDYIDGVLAAEASATAGTVTSEADDNPMTAADGPLGGSLLESSMTDGDGHSTTYAYNSAEALVSTTDPAGNQFTTWPTALRKPSCAGQATAAVPCSSSQTGPAPVSPGGAISPPSSPPPAGVVYSMYDTEGNELYSSYGVYPSGSSSASATLTDYTLYKGDTINLNGSSISCAAVPPTTSLPCATISAEGLVSQIAYDAQGDLTSISAPDGNGSEVATTTYSYDADGEQTSKTTADGNLPGANAGDRENQPPDAGMV